MEGEEERGQRMKEVRGGPPPPHPHSPPSLPTIAKQPGPHRVGQRIHAPTVLSQQAAGILHTPVGRRMQGGPAVPIPELRVVASLKEQSGGQEGLQSRTKTGVLHPRLTRARGAVTHDITEPIPGRW